MSAPSVRQGRDWPDPTGVLGVPDMAWIKPQFNSQRVNEASRVLLNPEASAEEHDAAISIINNWRSCHSFPLNSFQVVLRRRAGSLETRPLIARRLKRLPAIEAKLRRFPVMKLSAMQDIGGCRAVVKRVKTIFDLVNLYKTSQTSKQIYVREKDYINNPKDDGYRSYHLIYRYHSDAKGQRAWNDRLIEVQIRSRLQHAWATTVETVDFFTGQALKSSVGQQQWKRFSHLMGGALALLEGTVPVAGTPPEPKDLIDELRESARELRVVRTLTESCIIQ
ncbi:MAG: RelA/SpoT domain-containing protein [Candidatus Rokuibacteriota bacterium]